MLPQIIGVSMFNISKKGGYEVEEVNEFLARQRQDTGKVVSGLREINANLKKDNEEILLELNEYRKRDGVTASAAIIADAKKKADEIIKASQETFLLEIKKVQKVYEELVDTIKYVELKHGIEQDDKQILTKFKAQIKKILYECLDKEEQPIEEQPKAAVVTTEIKEKARLTAAPVFTRESEEVVNMTDNLNAAIWHESETERLNRLKTKEFKTASQWLDEKQASDNVISAAEFTDNKEKLRLGRTFTNTKIYGREQTFEERELENREKQIAANQTEAPQDTYARLINKYLKKPLSETNYVDTSAKAETKPKAAAENAAKGFNMRDALVNKQSLDEIMQSFEFYTSEENNENW